MEDKQHLIAVRGQPSIDRVHGDCTMRALTLLPKLATSRETRKHFRKALVTRRQIRVADFTFVSFPKSGRTWLRAMLTRLYQVRYNLPDGLLIGQCDLHKLNRRIPNIHFTHDCYPVGGVAALNADKPMYRGKRVAFLVRHPVDVVVSQYHQITKRKPGIKEDLSKGLDMFDFATEPGFGIHTIIAYENQWRNALDAYPGMMWGKYEDMRADPEEELSRLLHFLGERFSPAEILDAVDFCEFSNLQRLERSHYYKSDRLRPADLDDPASFKVRRGKVHGYVDDFTIDQLKILKNIVQAELDPIWQYEVEIPAPIRALAAS